MKAFLRFLPVLFGVGIVSFFVIRAFPENIYGMLCLVLWFGVCGVVGWNGGKLADKFWSLFGK